MGGLSSSFGHAVIGLIIAAFASTVELAANEPTFYQARIAPIFERHCTGCHGPERQKAGLRLDSYEGVMKGAESGQVIKRGEVKGSELFRRITLPASDEEVMPSEGKPLLVRAQIRNIELWIADGASARKLVAEFPGAPELVLSRAVATALAPDWQPRTPEIAALEKELGVRLIPRSQVTTNGLILRTAGAPGRVDDATLAKLGPLAEFIVEAELARTRVGDAGMEAVARWGNLRSIDLTRTAVTSAGLAKLAGLRQLEVVNLTDTAVDDAGVERLRTLPALQRAWLYGTQATVEAVVKEAAK